METCSVSGCGGKTYCGGLCSRHYNRLRTTGTTADGPRARGTFPERLWRQIEKRAPDDCWHWVGQSVIDGYGFIGRGGRAAGKVLAHRAVWELTYGTIPEGAGFHGVVVMHKCDNRLCCNPSHLCLGTQSQNVRDMDMKGRRQTVAHAGEKHHNARFTEADIRYMRTSSKRAVDIAREYGVDRQTIGNIRNRKSWTHIE